jgi:hypothetical protein
MSNETSSETSKLEELLRDYLKEGEKPEYDPKEVKVYAIMEGARREIVLPEGLQRKVLNEVRKPLYD